MMIKITEHCSMGCTHCMNNATPNNKHMDFDTFKKVIGFQKEYGGSFVIITGGEPTEHPEFQKFLRYTIQELKQTFITITTNGLWLQNNYNFVKQLLNCHDKYVMFQVTNDKRYYPTPLDESHPVYQLGNVVLCTEIEHIYPQGRAADNNLEWSSKGCKCFNIRAILHQINIKNLRVAIGMLSVMGKFCTPHIDIYGNIKLGESDLCPVCSNISKIHDDIVKDILNFKCDKCRHVNQALSQEHRKIIGEV